MTQEEKERFIRFNSLLEEIKDIDSSIDMLKVVSDSLFSVCRSRCSSLTTPTMKACSWMTRRAT